jgi:hypothetical protein
MLDSAIGHPAAVLRNVRILLVADGILRKHAGGKMVMALRNRDVVIVKIE